MARNPGNSTARWQLTTPVAPHQCVCYAECVLMEQVTFEIERNNGWAVGDVTSVVGLRPRSAHLAITDERLLRLENELIEGLPIDGWQPLLYVKGVGFTIDGQKVPGVRALLVGPGLCVAWV